MQNPAIGLDPVMANDNQHCSLSEMMDVGEQPRMASAILAIDPPATPAQRCRRTLRISSASKPTSALIQSRERVSSPSAQWLNGSCQIVLPSPFAIAQK